MSVSAFTYGVLGRLALAGLAAITLALMLASPLRGPPPLASIHEGAMRIDAARAPALSRYQARDGTWLAYRLYPAASGARDRVAIFAHGSSAESTEMHPIATALAAAGITAVALDIRGHGASGTRGDVAYLGQLDDDLADLIAELRKTFPGAVSLIGHSAGGGFALRIAGGPLGDRFDRFVLLAPYLGYSAPTNRPRKDRPLGVARHAADHRDAHAAGVWGRLAAIAAGHRLRQRAEAKMFVTSRLFVPAAAELYCPAPTGRAPSSGPGRIAVIAGADDELMDAGAYPRELRCSGRA